MEFALLIICTVLLFVVALVAFNWGFAIGYAARQPAALAETTLQDSSSAQAAQGLGGTGGANREAGRRLPAWPGSEDTWPGSRPTVSRPTPSSKRMSCALCARVRGLFSAR